MLWELPEPQKMIRKQTDDGCWKYPGKSIDAETGTNYFLLETYRKIGVLVDMYGFDRTHPAIQKAADYLFTCQTEEGDLRGILGNQYNPYYHGAILALLIKAGYLDEKPIRLGLDWLLNMQQDDGGWIVPTQMVLSKKRDSSFWLGEALQPDRSLPHAHLATGMVLRALAEHPDYRSKSETFQAGEALKSRILRADKYNDRKAVSYWLKFQYPFWWSNLLTALDTLAKLGYESDDEDIGRGLE